MTSKTPAVGVWGIGLDPAHERLLRNAEARCPDGLLPDGPTCPQCRGERLPSGIDGGTWVHTSRTPLCPEGHPMVEFEWTDGGARLYSCPQCNRP